jgi:hypothetical protein
VSRSSVDPGSGRQLLGDRIEELLGRGEADGLLWIAMCYVQAGT